MQISISIIMPIYNVEPYLRECLDTLITQTLKNIEIIAIDDKSTDNSYEILKEYEKCDNRIIALKNPYNLGPARTRNIGIQLARGKYLSILDSDDFFEPEFLEKMFAEAERTKADLTICDYYHYNNNTKKDCIYNFCPEYIRKKIHNPFNICEFSKEAFKLFSVVPFNKLILRTWLLDTGIAFQDLPNSNDVYFGYVVLISSQRTSYISDPLIHKRIGWGGNIENRRRKNPMSGYESIKKLYKFLKNNAYFSFYYTSFYSYVIDTIWSFTNLMEESEQRNFISFWKNSGLKSLDMLNLKREYFISDKMFLQWKLLVEKNLINLNDFRYALKPIYIKFFQELLDGNFQTALWGYGVEGKAFVKFANEYKYNLIEVYDNDENKYRLPNPFPIKSFDNRNKEINAIIITNYRFAKEIAKKVRMKDEKIRIFDFSSFLEYGINFEECEIFI